MIWFLDWIVWLVFMATAFTGLCLVVALLGAFWYGAFSVACDWWRSK